MTQTYIGLFLLITGLIVGHGAVTVIDTLGFIARRSHYWTQTTIRAHKVTKPLIWLGLTIGTVGGFLFYYQTPFFGAPFIHLVFLVLLILNGIYLSFVISPQLLDLEKQHQETKLLSKKTQYHIIASFIISLIGWWGTLATLVIYLTKFM